MYAKKKTVKANSANTKSTDINNDPTQPCLKFSLALKIGCDWQYGPADSFAITQSLTALPGTLLPNNYARVHVHAAA